MRKGIDINQRIPFSFPDDKVEPTIFIFKPLPAAEFSEFVGFDGKSRITSESIYSVLGNSIVEIKSFQIGEEVINAKDDDSKRRVFAALSIADLNSLLNEVLTMNKLGSAEQKNS